ncbi:MAG: ATP synthase subunit I [Pseudomonadota bacterium]|nr:MAG: ATP synthase subunit I [Pseudomonadota bacterium]
MNGKSTVYKIILAQLATALLVAGGAAAGFGARAGYSALTGGLIGVATNLYFAWHVFGFGGRSAQSVVRSFYVAEAIKMALTAALFVVAVLWLEAQPLPLIVTYGLTLMVYWAALLPTIDQTKADKA